MKRGNGIFLQDVPQEEPLACAEGFFINKKDVLLSHITSTIDKIAG